MGRFDNIYKLTPSQFYSTNCLEEIKRIDSTAISNSKYTQITVAIQKAVEEDVSPSNIAKAITNVLNPSDFDIPYYRAIALISIAYTANVDRGLEKYFYWIGAFSTYRGFNTRIFLEYGYKTLNLGLSSQTPILTKVLLNRYLDYLNLTLEIYEVYPTTFTLDGVESSLDLISNDINDLQSLRMAFKIKIIKTFNTLIYSITRDILEFSKSFTENRIKD